MREIYHSCQGESHKATDKPCQDCSYASVLGGISIAIVCDGHGGERYFRSDTGSRYAVEVTYECVCQFIRDVDKNLFWGVPFTQKSAISTDIINNDYKKDNDVDKAMKQLFSSIIYNWQKRILGHASSTPLSEAERSKLKQEYIADFENGKNLEKTYGCTLMCVAMTSDFWFGFHIGDGKCIAFDKEGNNYEPIPWDENCFLNKTTSLCDSKAIEKFRFCYDGTGNAPIAVFLGSDGIDDSFGDLRNMTNFYIQILKMICRESADAAQRSLREELPILSKRGSQDDMSIACLFDEEKVKLAERLLIKWQRNNVKELILALNQKIDDCWAKYQSFKKKLVKDRNDLINIDYAIKDITKAFKAKREAVNKYNVFSQELEPKNYIPYSDGIVESMYSFIGEEEPIENKTVDIPFTVKVGTPEEEQPVTEATPTYAQPQFLTSSTDSEKIEKTEDELAAADNVEAPEETDSAEVSATEENVVSSNDIQNTDSLSYNNVTNEAQIQQDVPASSEGVEAPNTDEDEQIAQPLQETANVAPEEDNVEPEVAYNEVEVLSAEKESLSADVPDAERASEETAISQIEPDTAEAEIKSEVIEPEDVQSVSEYEVGIFKDDTDISETQVESASDTTEVK